jgi:hypothetical protein
LLFRGLEWLGSRGNEEIPENSSMKTTDLITLSNRARKC